MKIVHSQSGLSCDLEENQIQILVVENPRLFLEYITDLQMLIETNEGQFIISNNGKELDFKKDVEMIFDPWSIDFDSRKIKSKLYSLLKDEIQENEYEKWCELKTHLFSFAESVIERIPYYATYADELEETDVIKLMDVRLGIDEESIPERIMEYIKLASSMLGIKVLIGVNFKSFLNRDELMEMYKCANYSKITLILIENHQTEKLEQEKVTIIDQDCCIIAL